MGHARPVLTECILALQKENMPKLRVDGHTFGRTKQPRLSGAGDVSEVERKKLCNTQETVQHSSCANSPSAARSCKEDDTDA